MKKITRYVIIGALVSGVLGTTGAYFYQYYTTYYTTNHGFNYGPAGLYTGIRAYTEQDKAFFKRVFSENFYFLTSNMQTNIDNIVDTLSPNEYEQRYRGKLKIVVLYETEFGKPEKQIGFCCYYMLNEYIGRLLFLCIDKQVQGKRYGERLVQYALEDLRRMGAKFVRMWCRIENSNARKLYERLGFVNLHEDLSTGFIDYRKNI